MRPISTRSFLNVKGSWNQAIFSPEWLARRVLSGKEPELQVGFSDRFLLRFSTADAVVVVAPTNLRVAPLGTKASDVWVEPLRILLGVLHVLPETPVHTVEINAGYELSHTVGERVLGSAMKPLHLPGVSVNLCPSSARLRKTFVHPPGAVHVSLRYDGIAAVVDVTHEFAVGEGHPVASWAAELLEQRFHHRITESRTFANAAFGSLEA